MDTHWTKEGFNLFISYAQIQWIHTGRERAQLIYLLYSDTVDTHWTREGFN